MCARQERDIFASTKTKTIAMKDHTTSTEQLFAKTFFFAIFLLVLSASAFAQPCMCGNGRYLHSIFSNYIIASNVQYTQNASAKYDGSMQQEKMDIWGPQNDNCTKRPVIIWIHGGGFAQNDKTAPDVVAMCDSFSRHGFVCATIDYRDDYWGPYGPVNDYSTNPTPYDNLEFDRADYRAMQDAKCAVRYFKANASLYGIDTNYIFMGGTSAGAWTSLMVAYLNKASEKLPAAYQQSMVANMYTRPDLGSIDGNGGWSTCSSKVRGIISCWGALPDTALIDGPNDVPAIMFHEYGDPVVNYYYGAPFQGQYPNFNSYWGSYYNNMQMNNMGVDHEFYSFNGSQHSLYPYRGAVTIDVSNFLDSIICSSLTTGIHEELQNSSIFSVYPNPGNGVFNIELKNSGSAEIKIYDMLGKEISAWRTGEEKFSFDLSNYSKGIYLMKVICGEQSESKKIIIE